MNVKDKVLTKLSEAELAAALDICAAEPVHIPGCVQSHGAMIAVHPDTMTICFASQNTEQVLGIEAKTLFEGTIADHFGGEVYHSFANGIRVGPPVGEALDIGPMSIGGKNLWVSACPGGDYAILQFEPLDEDVSTQDVVLRDLSQMTSQIEQADNLDVLFGTTVEMLRTLMGYDRVLIYKFDADFNGSVVAESVASDLEPFLGLNFPKWDIPVQAREIMRKIPLRYVADATAESSQMLKAHPMMPDLNMTAATLRGVSEMHLEYLRNMAHLGTMTLHLRSEGKLWGVISLMNSAPRKPAQRQRQVCQHFVWLFEAKLSHLSLAERMGRLEHADNLRVSLNKVVSTHTKDEVYEVALLAELRNVMRAVGAAVVVKGNLITSGTTPTHATLRDIIHGKLAPVEGVFASSALASDAPELAKIIGDSFPGLLLVPLPEGVTFVFFRHGRDSTVNWAGAPEKAVEFVNGHARIKPRGSFAKYQISVKGTSQPWSDEEMRLANDLWALLVTAERQELIEKTNRQQKILINELNHRVRNILALIRSLSQQTLKHNGSIESYVRALEARIAAVAAAHDLGADSVATAVTVGQIIQVEAAPYNEGTKRVFLEGHDMGIREEFAPLFALVIHELMTNAVKYGALSNDTGHVNVNLTPSGSGDSDLEIKWVELGGPEVNTERVGGFGTTLIEKSIPFELGGHVEMEFHPDGVRALISLPKSSLSTRTSFRSGQELPSISPAPPDVTARALVRGESLLVEDNFVVSLDTQKVLKTIGFRSIETASTAEDALAKLQKFTPNFAILDVNLGNGHTSLPVARLLRERNIPFVFVTGYGESAPLPSDYQDVPILKKPLRKDEIIHLIDQISE